MIDSMLFKRLEGQPAESIVSALETIEVHARGAK